MLIITKEKSTIIKGILICMMVFLHLFNGKNTDQCTNLLYINNIPFAKWLSGACGPVAFFLLLSGYGLAYTYNHKGISFFQQAKRIYKLYIHYWVTIIIFVPIGIFIGIEKYPGTISIFIQNIIGWSYSYNEETWFLFPYCFISLTSFWIIKYIKKIGNIKAIIIAAFIQIGTCFLISRYGAEYLYNNMFLYRPVQYLHFIYPFTIGVILFRTKKTLDSSIPSWIVAIIIVLTVSYNATYGNSISYMLYVPLMTFLFCHLKIPRCIEKILFELGLKSMSIWLIHTWYCYYLFRNEIYSLKYPLLIFIVTLLLSYLTSIIVMWIAKHLINIKFR